MTELVLTLQEWKKVILDILDVPSSPSLAYLSMNRDGTYKLPFQIMKGAISRRRIV